MSGKDLLLRLFARHTRSPNQAIERFKQLVSEAGLPFDPTGQLREMTYPPQPRMPHGLPSFIYYFVPGSGQGSEVPLPASASSPAFLKSADGIALNLGCPLRLWRALEGFQKLIEAERAPLLAPLRDPRNHLAAVEEALWINGWKVAAVRRGAKLPGAKGDVDWRLEAGGTVVHLEAKFRRSDWARLVHPDSFVKSGEGFLSKAMHKFPERKPGAELHVVGITVFDEGTERLLEAVDAELHTATQIHGVVIRGMLQMTHVLAREAAVGQRIKELIAVPDGGAWPGHYPIMFHIEQRDERAQAAAALPQTGRLRCYHHWIGPANGPKLVEPELGLYRLSIPHRESNGEPHFNIIQKFLMEQTGEAIEGFDSNSGMRMREIGLAEELNGVKPPPGGKADSPVKFTDSAVADWEFLHGSRIIGAPIQLDAVLAEGMSGLIRGRLPKREIQSLGGDGAVWYQRGLRWVFRFVDEDRSMVVHGIAQARLNPFRKIWRYFDQDKAIDLLERGELYLCRVDRLADPYEARPTKSMLRVRQEALRRQFGPEWSDDPDWYEYIRRALYVTCFQKSEIESAEMWRDYCPSGSGLAIQMTERTLQHEVARLRRGIPELFFREIDYIDHESHDPAQHGVPEQAFLKRRKFAHEREIRLARFIPGIFCGTQADIERALAGLADHYRIPFNLDAAVEVVVLHPAASPECRAALQQALANRAQLTSRIRGSSLRND
ncbi:MAG: hypothetical protein SFV32_05640 [Opitutaceae bacterium]|nr:hypothetical protein [Opitutaceae bacterium]